MVEDRKTTSGRSNVSLWGSKETTSGNLGQVLTLQLLPCSGKYVSGVIGAHLHLLNGAHQHFEAVSAICGFKL